MKDANATEESNYGSIGKNDESYKRLRLSEVLVDIDRDIEMQVNSYTDPVQSKFKSPKLAIEEFRSNYRLTNNDILSAYRTATILKKFKDEINVLAGTYMTREEAKVIIDLFNRAYEKVRISIGPISLKIGDF